jgi:hypothetical protein
MRVCIGIVCIGEKYIQKFETTCKPSVDRYAKKHGYDLKLFTSFLDESHAHTDCISFQKCLVPRELKDYDCVVVMDADIYVHEDTPPIHALLTDTVGIVNEVAQVSPEQYKMLGFASDPTEYYKLAGFDLKTDKILNTGVILCDPKRDWEFLEGIYEKHIGASIGHPRKFHYEQGCIGYELQTTNRYSLLPNDWNHIYLYDKVLGLPQGRTYFLHFAGCGPMNLAAQRPQSALRWGIHKKR